MKKETKQEIKELIQVFAITVLSSFMVLQCNSNVSELKMPKSKSVKKENTITPPDTMKTTTSVIRDDLFRAHKIKTR